MLYGVDIHGRYQAGISIATLAREGYSFATVKATEGTSVRPPGFESWIGQIRAAGMIPGAYHWLRAGDGAAQARYFLARVANVGGPRGLLVQLDCEDDATWSDVQEWHYEFRRLAGAHPYLVYTGAWWWAPKGWPGASLTPYLWHSHYLTADADTVSDDPAAFAARIPASWWTPGYGGWSAATILQFTSKGDAGTLGNGVDLNTTKLTREQLLALTGAGGGSAGPLPIGDDMALDDRLPLTKDVNAPSGYTVEQVLSQLHASISQGRRVLGPGQTYGGGLPIWWAPGAWVRAELAALEARLEAKEVARHAAEMELLRQVQAAAGNPMSDEQLATAVEALRNAAADAGAAAGDRVLADLHRQEAEREAGLRAALAAETAS